MGWFRRRGFMNERVVRLASILLASVCILATPTFAQQPPPDGTWTADAVVDEATAMTVEGLGAAQGIAIRGDKVYAYGDVHSANPRVGVIREYTLDLTPTGRVVWLRRDGKPLITHPTGLTWDDRWGTLLGDTFQKKAKIYRLDWERAWADGNLDHAVKDVIDDDAAINGCRPTFVTVRGKRLIATADYGDIHPEIRLYDPEPLFKALRSSAPGVIVHQILSGPWNQNLHWDVATGRLTCVQNVIEGRGWRLETVDLARAVDDGRVSGPGVRSAVVTFSPHDELEGYWPVDRTHALLVTSSRSGNVVRGVIRPTSPVVSAPAPVSGPAPAPATLR